jgi:hypothetical protein
VLAVEAELEDALLAALDAAAADIAPRLRTPQDAAWVLDRLYGALGAAWDASEGAWRRLYPRDAVSDDGGED